MATARDNLMFRAFADERRLRILHLLRGQEMCVGDLVEVLQLPQSTVSRQLGILREAGLISSRETGMWRHYTLDAPESPLHHHLLDCLGRCFPHVPELQEDAAHAESLLVGGGCCPDDLRGTDSSARSCTAPLSEREQE